MGLVIKKTALPYKSLIFNYRNLDQSDILFNDTGLTWTILSTGTGILEIKANVNDLDQNKYCVLVTPMRVGNNHSIAVLDILGLSDTITLYCAENGNNTLTDDGFNSMTVQINFFNL